MIRYKCSQCGAMLQSPASMAGQTDECPRCGDAHVVPRSSNTGLIVLAVCAWLVLGGLVGVIVWLRSPKEASAPTSELASNQLAPQAKPRPKPAPQPESKPESKSAPEPQTKPAVTGEATDVKGLTKGTHASGGKGALQPKVSAVPPRALDPTPAAKSQKKPPGPGRLAEAEGLKKIPYGGAAETRKKAKGTNLLELMEKMREQRRMAELAALGLAPRRGEERKANVQVSESLVVTDVPISTLQSRLLAAKVTISALGVQNGTVGDPPGNPAEDRLRRARGFVRWWFTNTTPFIMKAVHKRKDALTNRDLIKGDARIDDEKVRALMVFGGHSGPINAKWLIPADATAMGGSRRGNVLFSKLLDRFDPEQAVTEANAEMVAEELTIMQSLSLGDVTWRSLPDCRRAIQALLLDQLGFQVGDPTDKDPAKRRAALQKLREAKEEFRKIAAEAQKAK